MKIASMLFALVLLLAAGCMKSYHVQMGSQLTDEPRYVIIVEKAASGRLKVYDCLSKPDGRNWDPTCVRIDFKSRDIRDPEYDPELAGEE